MPIYGRGISGVQDDPKWKDNAEVQDPRYRGGVRADAGTWSVDGQVQGPGFPGLSDYERKRGVVFMTLLPTGYWVGHPDYVRVVRIKPAGPTETELQIEWLFAKETLELAGFDLKKIVDFGLMVIQEDGRACEINQRGMSALPFDEGVLLPQEYSVKDFQDWVRKQLTD
jgi:glycine betaine catabolism A